MKIITLYILNLDDISINLWSEPERTERKEASVIFVVSREASLELKRSM